MQARTSRLWLGLLACAAVIAVAAAGRHSHKSQTWPYPQTAPAGSTDQPAGSLHRSQRLLQAHSTPGRTLLQAIQDTRWLSPNGKKIERPNVSAAGLSVAWYNTPPSPQLPPGADGAWYRDQGQGSRLRVGKDDSEKPWEWKSPKKASEGRWIPLSASASAPPDEPTTSQAPAADTATPPLAPPAATTATATPAPATGSLPPPPAAGMPPITRPQAAPASNARVDPRQSPSPPAPKPPATPPVNQRGARPSNPASSTSPSAASVDPRQPLGQPTLSASQRSPTPPVDEGGVRAPRVPRGAPPTAADTLSSRPSSGSSSSSSPGSASAMALPLRNDNWVKLVGRAKPEPTAAWYVYKPLPDDKEGLRVVKDETDYQRPSFAEGRELGEECGDDKTGPYASCKNSVCLELTAFAGDGNSQDKGPKDKDAKVGWYCAPANCRGKNPDCGFDKTSGDLDPRRPRYTFPKLPEDGAPVPANVAIEAGLRQASDASKSSDESKSDSKP